MPKELKQRIISALILVIAAIVYLFYMPFYLFLAATAVVGLIGQFEFGRAGRKKGLPLFQPALYLQHLLLFGYFWASPNYPSQETQWALVAIAISLIVHPLVFKQKILQSIKWNLFSLLWITVPFYVLVWLRFDYQNGSNLILYVLSIAAFSDIFAYFGGKKFGKHKLAPSISPGKTIEGSSIGLLFAMILGVYFGRGLFPNLEIWLLALMVALITVVSQAGDLIESKFKRFCGVKDSGTLLPGHGGILDRFDAYLTSLPLFWAIILYFGL